MDSQTIIIMVAIGFIALLWVITWVIQQAHSAIPKEVLDKYDNVVGRYAQQNNELHSTLNTLMPTFERFAEMAIKFTPDKRDDQLYEQVKELVKSLETKKEG